MLLQKGEMDQRLALYKCMTICVPKGLCCNAQKEAERQRKAVIYQFLLQLEKPKSLLNEKNLTQITKEKIEYTIIKFLSLPRQITDIVPLLCRM